MPVNRFAAATAAAVWTVCLLAAGPLSAAPEAKPDAAKPADPKVEAAGKALLEKLQGDWECVGAVFRGKALPESELPGIKFAVRGSDLVVISGDNKREEKTGLRINTATDPVSVDLVAEKKVGDDGPLPAILKLDGDRLDICFATEGRPRPTRFASADEDCTNLFRLRRPAKKDDAPKPAAAVAEPKPDAPKPALPKTDDEKAAAAKALLDKLQGEWEIVSLVVKGEVEAEAAKAVFVFRGDEVNIVVPDKTRVEKARIRLITGTDPVQMDLLAGGDGNAERERVPGIIRLEGDKLELCWAKDDGAAKRPEVFASKADDRTCYAELKRRKGGDPIRIPPAPPRVDKKDEKAEPAKKE